MPDTPFPVQGNDVNETMRRLQQLIEDMYEERIGGASLGDVFQVGDDDVLSLNIADEGGLEKSGGELQVKAGNGITVSSSGVAVKASTGISVSSSGVALKQQNHEADASTSHATADFAGVNTALDLLGTKINNILKKLEDAEILKTS